MKVPQMIDFDSCGELQKLPKERSIWGEIQPKLFSSLFLSEGHYGLIHDCEIIFISKENPLDPTRRELLWRRVFEDIAPLGLDIGEGCDY